MKQRLLIWGEETTRQKPSYTHYQFNAKVCSKSFLFLWRKAIKFQKAHQREAELWWSMESKPGTASFTAFIIISHDISGFDACDKCQSALESNTTALGGVYSGSPALINRWFAVCSFHQKACSWEGLLILLDSINPISNLNDTEMEQLRDDIHSCLQNLSERVKSLLIIRRVTTYRTIAIVCPPIVLYRCGRYELPRIQVVVISFIVLTLTVSSLNVSL